MNEGRIEQISPPRGLFEYPVSKYAANFVGENNVLKATVTQTLEQSFAVSTPLGDLTGRASSDQRHVAIGDEVEIVVRADRIQLTKTNGADSGPRGTVQGVAYSGAYTDIEVSLATKEIIEIRTYASGQDFRRGETVNLKVLDSVVIL
jgi:ABC-type Fe3+/spermidine/putrescine transport system ATPase subunit